MVFEVSGHHWQGMGHWCRHLLEPPTQPPTLSDVATKAGYLSQLPSSCQKQMKLLISIGAMKKCGHLADQYSKCSLHSVQACTLLFGQGHWEVHVWKMRATGNKSKSSHCANAQEERGFTNQSAHVYGLPACQCSHTERQRQNLRHFGLSQTLQQACSEVRRLADCSGAL